MQQMTRTRSIAYIAMGIALMAVSAFITVPLGPIPFTLQTLVLVLLCCLLPPREAIIAMVGYVLLGAIGLPIFSGFRGGFGVIAGPTGGFIIAFIVDAVVATLLRRQVVKATGRELAGDIVAVICILCISYLLGWTWLKMTAGLTWGEAFAAAVAPFVVVDIIKGIVAVAVATPVRKALGLQASKKQAGASRS